MQTIVRFLALMGILCLGSTLCARPFTIDDMLDAEAFGDSGIDPSGRWLVYAVERPLSEAPQIDYNAMDVIRSRLFVADLRHPGASRPLDPSDRESGMVVYCFSPNGTRLAVGRLKGSSWQLGIVTMATGAIQWTGVSPDYDPYQTTVDWTAEEQIVAITVGDDRLPFWLSADRSMFEDLAANWQRQKIGRAPTVTVVGSGRWIGVTPHVADRRLALIDLTTGGSKTLATGDFRSLTLSPDRRFAAISEQTTPINLAADQPLHENDQTRRHRLVLFDLATGGRENVCADCDIRTSKPVWRSTGGEVLFGGGRDDRPAADVTAWTFMLATREIEQVLPNGLEMTDPISAYGPTDLSLGWADGEPILFARPADESSGRLDWYQVGDGERRCLTCSIADVGSRLIQTDHDEPIMVAGTHGWRLGTGGPALVSTGDGAQELLAAGRGRARSGLLTWRKKAHEINARIVGATAWSVRMPASPGLTLLTASGMTGRVVGVRRFPTGMQQILAFAQGSEPVIISTINPQLDAIDEPDIILLSHPVSDGTTASSWLLVPPGLRSDDKLPMIVIPYPGRLQGGAAPPQTPPDQRTDNPWPLLGHGYAVLLPDVPAVQSTSGGRYRFGADILAAVDAAIATGHVDPNRLGLYGHSFGGLTAAILATQTNRFKAIVASAGTYDLVSQRGIFTPWTRLDPGHGQSIAAMGGFVETFQPALETTPWADPAPYLAASSVFHADKVRTPMLIQAGDADALSLQQGEELFSALYRQGKDAELVSYWGEDHVLASPANVRDFFQRMFDWFDCHFDPAGKACPGIVASR